MTPPDAIAITLEAARNQGTYRFLLEVTVTAGSPAEARELEDEAVTRIAGDPGVLAIHAHPPVPTAAGEGSGT